MPDKDGKIRPVSFPVAPWCARCKLFACVCKPASKPLPAVTAFPYGTPYARALVVAAEHTACGSSRCCGTC